MGNATGTSFKRRQANGDFEKFFKGKGIDIGCGGHPIEVEGVIKHDRIFNNDALDLTAYENETFDFVYSSHCLEHLSKPRVALKEWWRVVKVGGYLIIVVPEYSLYEKRQRPSRFNTDHKTVFTLGSLFSLVNCFLPMSQIIRLQINDEGFDYKDFESDQTSKGAQAEIELIIRKVSDHFWADNNMRVYYE